MKNSLLALGLLAALPFAASAAENLSYTYVEADYVKSDASRGGLDADGWGLQGSYAFHPNFHVFGGYAKQSVDVVNLDVNLWNLGVGYNYAISDSTDLLARVAYRNVDPQQFRHFNGWSGEVGLRNAFGPRFSTYLLGGYENYSKRDGFNPDGQFYGRLGGQVNFNKNWSVSGDIKMYTQDGDVQWSVGPRLSW